MNTLLRIAKKEVDKLKNNANNSAETALNLVIDFSRNEDDLQRLVGYSAFKAEFEKLPPTNHPTENIYRACEASNMNVASVIFQQTTDTISIPIRCKTELARIFIANHNLKGDF